MMSPSTDSPAESSFELIPIEAIHVLLTDILANYQLEWEKHPDNNKLLQAKIEHLLGLPKGKLENTLRQLRWKIMGQVAGLDGYVATATIDRVRVKFLSREEKDAIKAIPDLINQEIIKYANSEREHYLLYHLCFLTELYLSIQLEFIPPHRLPVAKQRLSTILQNEIWIIANAYLIHEKCLALFKLKKPSEKEAQLTQLAKDILTSFSKLATDKKDNLPFKKTLEICLPTGSTDHAVYLTLIYYLDSDEIAIRIDNADKEQPTVIRLLHPTHTTTVSEAVQYIKTALLAMTKPHETAMREIYQGGNASTVPPHLNDYPSRPRQSVPNCAVEGIRIGMWYRLQKFADTQGNKVFDWLKLKDMEYASVPHIPEGLFKRTFENVILEDQFHSHIVLKTISQKLTSCHEAFCFAYGKSSPIRMAFNTYRHTELDKFIWNIKPVISQFLGLPIQRRPDRADYIFRNAAYEKKLCDFFQTAQGKTKIAILHGQPRCGMGHLAEFYFKNYHELCLQNGITYTNADGDLKIKLRADNQSNFEKAIEDYLKDKKEVTRIKDFYDYLEEHDNWLVYFEDVKQSDFLTKNFPSISVSKKPVHRHILIKSFKGEQISDSEDITNIFTRINIKPFDHDEMERYLKQIFQSYPITDKEIHDLVSKGLQKNLSIADFKVIADTIIKDKINYNQIHFNRNDTCPAKYFDIDSIICLIENTDNFFLYHLNKGIKEPLQELGIKNPDDLVNNFLFLDYEIHKKAFYRLIADKKISSTHVDNIKILNIFREAHLLENHPDKNETYIISSRLLNYLTHSSNQISDKLRDAIMRENLNTLDNILPNIDSRSSKEACEIADIFCMHAKNILENCTDSRLKTLNSTTSNLISLFDKVKPCSSKDQYLFFCMAGHLIALENENFNFAIRYISRQIQFYNKDLLPENIKHIANLSKYGNELLPKVDDQVEVIRFFSSLGTSYYRLGLIKKSFCLMRATLDLVEREKNIDGKIILKNELGEIHKKAGLFQLAGEYYSERIKLLEQHDLSQSYSYTITLLNLHSLCIEHPNETKHLCENLKPLSQSQIEVLLNKIPYARIYYKLYKTKKNYHESSKFRATLNNTRSIIDYYNNTFEKENIFDDNYISAIYLYGKASLKLELDFQRAITNCEYAYDIIAKSKDPVYLQGQILDCIREALEKKPEVSSRYNITSINKMLTQHIDDLSKLQKFINNSLSCDHPDYAVNGSSLFNIDSDLENYFLKTKNITSIYDIQHKIRNWYPDFLDEVCAYFPFSSLGHGLGRGVTRQFLSSITQSQPDKIPDIQISLICYLIMFIYQIYANYNFLFNENEEAGLTDAICHAASETACPLLISTGFNILTSLSKYLENQEWRKTNFLVKSVSAFGSLGLFGISFFKQKVFETALNVGVGVGAEKSVDYLFKRMSGRYSKKISQTT